MVSDVKKATLTLAALLLTAAMAVPAMAETLYVRDVVIINMRSAPQPNAETVSLLRTGDSFEVLEESGRYYRVKSEKGETGWIDSQYAVEERPAVLLVRDAVAKADRAAVAAEKATRSVGADRVRLPDPLRDPSSCLSTGNQDGRPSGLPAGRHPRLVRFGGICRSSSAGAGDRGLLPVANEPGASAGRDCRRTSLVRSLGPDTGDPRSPLAAGKDLGR